MSKRDLEIQEQTMQLLRHQSGKPTREALMEIYLYVGSSGTACQCQGESCVYCDIRKIIHRAAEQIRRGAED